MSDFQKTFINFQGGGCHYVNEKVLYPQNDAFNNFYLQNYSKEVVSYVFL